MLIHSVHTIKDPEILLPIINEIIKEAFPKLRLRQRLISEDKTKLLLLWEVPSLEDFHHLIELDLRSKFQDTIFTHILDPILPPVINSVFPFSVIKPGGGVIVLGSHFGAQPGEFLLVGNFPGGQLNLTNLQWGETFVSGTIPFVTGVPDQDAFLQIKQHGMVSNLFPVRFTAMRVVQMLPGSVLTRVSCGGDQIDVCYVGRDSDPFTIAGLHAAQPGFDSGDGHDVYNCSLQNGWVFDHYHWGPQNGINGGPFGVAPDPVGQSSFTVDVHWFFDVFGSSNYELSLFVVGPAGIPFN